MTDESIQSVKFRIYLGGYGDEATNQANLQISRETNRANRELANLENQWNIEQWNRENNYNSPIEQIERYKAAGLA